MNLDERPIRIIPDTKYPNMYKLQWKNGDISVRYWDGIPMDDGIPITSYGLYNLTRAKDILKHYREYAKNIALRSANSLPGKTLNIDS